MWLLLLVVVVVMMVNGAIQEKYKNCAVYMSYPAKYNCFDGRGVFVDEDERIEANRLLWHSDESDDF